MAEESIQWRGPQVARKVQSAAESGVNETMGMCVRQAKQDVPVVFAILQGSIRLEPAETQDGDVVGKWGSFDVHYAAAVETGNRSLVGPESSGWARAEHGARVAEGRVRNTGNRNFLRNAADQEYPRLAARIRKHMRR